ncbi:hypothetical protein [Jatrophihabitans sp.]|uniref:hypothetical protein n=1 Tax=Jatrophihabitans sp. TaxID=1932789 RepID=UPI0030C774FA|nr:hypothetical protein [Jatrophihabitans sp.]
MTAVEAEVWPESPARSLFEATMLDCHATALSARYPVEIWRGLAKDAMADSRTAQAVQQAFVDGIRFACKQLLDQAADMRDAADTRLREREAVSS